MLRWKKMMLVGVCVSFECVSLSTLHHLTCTSFAVDFLYDIATFFLFHLLDLSKNFLHLRLFPPVLSEHFNPPRRKLLLSSLNHKKMKFIFLRSNRLYVPGDLVFYRNEFLANIFYLVFTHTQIWFCWWCQRSIWRRDEIWGIWYGLFNLLSSSQKRRQSHLCVWTFNQLMCEYVEFLSIATFVILNG